DPTYRAANKTTLDAAAADFIESRQRKGCAAGTLAMYDVKIAHLGRVLGKDLLLARLGAQQVDRYIDTRLAERAKRSTIGKELTALRGILKVAKRAGKFSRDIDSVMPVEWSADYEPRKRALKPAEAARLLRYLAAPRAKKDRWGNERAGMGAPRN